MDTRFWGPDGWKLLHSIVEGYPSKPTKKDKTNYRIFFNSLIYVLPCIYCRNSFKEYLDNLPIDNFLSSKNKLSYWLYLIHNMVNEKLRKQKLHNQRDPSFQEIKTRYKQYVKDINQSKCVNMPGWDFIYTIVFNFPLKGNTLEKIRLKNYILFFKYLDKVLPFKQIKTTYSKIIKNTNMNEVFLGRTILKKWFFNTEKKIKKTINCNCIKYRERCLMIEKYRAGCNGKNDKKPTCRKLRKI